MYSEKVRSVGISLLGGNSGSAGKYELGIDSIRLVNDEDVIRTSSTYPAVPLYDVSTHSISNR